jgi:hypothetical protein
MYIFLANTRRQDFFFFSLRDTVRSLVAKRHDEIREKSQDHQSAGDFSLSILSEATTFGISSFGDISRSGRLTGARRVVNAVRCLGYERQCRSQQPGIPLSLFLFLPGSPSRSLSQLSLILQPLFSMGLFSTPGTCATKQSFTHRCRTPLSGFERYPAGNLSESPSSDSVYSPKISARGAF